MVEVLHGIPGAVGRIKKARDEIAGGDGISIEELF
jgi:hypothetical protein